MKSLFSYSSDVARVHVALREAVANLEAIVTIVRISNEWVGLAPEQIAQRRAALEISGRLLETDAIASMKGGIEAWNRLELEE